MSKSGTVSIVDSSTPGRLALLGQTTLAGEPFEMYRRGDFLIAMSNDARRRRTAASRRVTRTARRRRGGALVIRARRARPRPPVEVATLKVPGEIADSRIVGNVLYLATYENVRCFGCGKRPRTMVTTSTSPIPPRSTQVDQVSFESNAPASYNLRLGIELEAQHRRHRASASTSAATPTSIPNLGYGSADEGIIDVLDISDPNGRLTGRGAHHRRRRHPEPLADRRMAGRPPRGEPARRRPGGERPQHARGRHLPGRQRAGGTYRSGT